jgi:sugar phosphate isomerase/epimerase
MRGGIQQSDKEGIISKILCSTGAFSRDPDLTNTAAILDGIRRVDCDGYELIFYPSFYAQMADTIKDLTHIGDRFATLHTEKSIGPLLGVGSSDDVQTALQRLQLNLDLAGHLGINRVVLHLWGLPASDQNIERNVSNLGRCIEAGMSRGIEVTVESIPCIQQSPLTHLRTIATSYPEVQFTLDTEFLAMHGELVDALKDAAVLERTVHFHLKDYSGSLVDSDGRRIYLHPGEGQIDFDMVIKHCLEAEHPIDLCLESTSVNPDGSVSYDRVDRDLRYLRDRVSQLVRPS